MRLILKYFKKFFLWLLSLFYDSLKEFEPITNDEMLLLSVVDEDQYKNLLIYLRTLKMHKDLQDYLANEKQALEAISYYLLIQASKAADLKNNDTQSLKLDKTSYAEKIVLQRLKQWKTDS